MKGIVKGVLWSVLVAGIATSSFGQTKRIRASEAKKHIGQRYSVCGTVVSGHYAQNTNGTPTFIDLDKAYPQTVFTIVIWGSDRRNFNSPETAYSNRTVCVTGVIATYRSVPQIVIHTPNEIAVVDHF
jgi:hypothetical protein